MLVKDTIMASVYNCDETIISEHARFEFLEKKDH